MEEEGEKKKGRIRIEEKLKRYEKIDFLGEGQVIRLPCGNSVHR